MKTQDGVEERMESANKAWWRDAKIYKNKDVPWRTKSGAYSSFEGENWSWSSAVLDRVRGWETKVCCSDSNEGRKKHGKVLYEDSDGGKNYLEEDRASILI